MFCSRHGTTSTFDRKLGGMQQTELFVLEIKALLQVPQYLNHLFPALGLKLQ
jgi:hypothetical protein